MSHHRPRNAAEDSPSEADKEQRRRRQPPTTDNATTSSSSFSSSAASAAFPVLLQRLGEGLVVEQQLRYLKGTVIHQLNQLLKLRGVEADLEKRIENLEHNDSVTRMSPLFR